MASNDPAVRARLASAGRAVPAVQIQIRDEEGVALGAGAAGRIWVRGDQVSGEYAEGGPAVDVNGYFDTRDHGYLDAEGYLFVAGRADDTIIRGGENISPAEIEDVLLRHPDVEDAAVVGIPDDEWGQRIEAAVVVRAGTRLVPDSLRNHVRERLRASKTPDKIVLLSQLPRTETGKLIRREVVQSIQAATSVDRDSATP
jgi:acyl-CoA synthetase (AMP-forming)/AMP-acid ligase II